MMMSLVTSCHGRNILIGNEIDTVTDRISSLAHQIRTSEILPWDRKSCLTYVILPRLSREGCTMAVLEVTHMGVVCCHCYVESQRTQELLEAYFEIKNYAVQEKESIICVRWDRKIRPSRSPFAITRQAL